MFGEDGDDSILGQGGNDTLEGGDGADTIDGGTGTDTINGGDGSDSITGDDGADSIDAGSGSDNVDAGLGDDTVNGGNGEDTINGGIGNDHILGGELADILLGNGGNDTINGQAGNDAISGGIGDDSLEGGANNDTVLGQAGNDTLNGQAGNDQLFGGDDQDRIFGGAGDDLANGDLGDDFVQGQSGNDTLIGGGGADTVDGGAGKDFLLAAQPDISIDTAVSILEGDAGISAVDFTITRSSPSAVAVTVDFSTQDGTAISGLDYQGVSGTLTFLPGTTTQTVSVPVLADNVQEGDETFQVLLSNPTNGLLLQSQSNATIIDDDAAGPLSTISIGDVTVTEGDVGTTNANFVVTLSQASTLTVTADFATQDGTATAPQDYQATFGTITFAPSQTQQTISVPIVGDTTVESTEFFFVLLSNLQNVTTLDIQGVGTILDDLGGGFQTEFPPALNTITFDEVPTQPINGLTVEGVTFGFTEGGVPSTDAVFNTFVGPSLTTVIQPPNLEGSSSGILTMDFANPVVSISFGVARSSGIGTASDLQVQLFDAMGTLVQTTNVPLSVINIFIEGQFFYNGSPVTRAVVDFTVAGVGSGPRFAIDNLTTDDTVLPPPPPPPPSSSDLFGDTLLGGDGDDTIFGSAFNDVINVGAGNDSVDGGLGNDSILGGSGNDTLFGNLGNDTLNGQGGTDSLDGGDGDDTFVWEGASSSNDFLTDSVGDNQLLVNGSGSANTLTVGQSFHQLLTITESARTVTLGPTFTRAIINTNNGDDTVNIGDISKVPAIVLEVRGGAGNDSIIGTGGLIGNVRLLLDGGDGNDTIRGTLGDDTLTGGIGNDNLKGGGGSDLILGEDGDDTIDGQGGSDTVAGHQGIDTIIDPQAEINEAFVLPASLRTILDAQ